MAGLVDKIPMGRLMNKGLTIRTGQTHVNRWTDDLLRRIEEGQIDPSFVITHTRQSRGRARDVQGVPRQAGQLHQGRPEALKTGREDMAYYISNIARSEGDPKILRSGPSSLGAADRLAKALGWFSIGLGLTELIAPERITRALGMEGKEALVRAYGVRELGHGIVSLSTDKHLGLWSRVAGDGLDIATLMTAMRHDNPKRDNVGIALAAVLGVTLLDIIGAQGGHGAPQPPPWPATLLQGSDRLPAGCPGGARRSQGLPGASGHAGRTSPRSSVRSCTAREGTSSLNYRRYGCVRAAFTL